MAWQVIIEGINADISTIQGSFNLSDSVKNKPTGGRLVQLERSETERIQGLIDKGEALNAPHLGQGDWPPFGEALAYWNTLWRAGGDEKDVKVIVPKESAAAYEAALEEFEATIAFQKLRTT